MKKLMTILLSLIFILGCQTEQMPLSPSSSLQTNLAKAVSSELEVTPVFRVKTEKSGEWLTVFVFHANMGRSDGRGGGKKPPKETEVCLDLNTNQAFAELGVVLPSANFPVEYHPVFEPTNAFDAIDRAVSAWEDASSDSLLDFVYNALGTAAPARDFTNVVGWRQFVGRGSGFLAATFIWDDGTTILEADIFYNLKHKWAVNTVIAAGDSTCGTNFDIQAIGTHEFGHLIGLGHVVNANEADATMAPSAAKGELQKQTLTPGDIAGVLSVMSN